MSLKSQLQIRENMMELQDYVSDLYDWETDMKRADRKIAKGFAHNRMSENAGENCPPVRGETAFAPKKGPTSLQRPSPQFSQGTTPQGSTVQTGRRGVVNKKADSHTYKNYGRWDNFDINAALEEASDGSDCETSKKPGPVGKLSQPPIPPSPPETPMQEIRENKVIKQIDSKKKGSVVPRIRKKRWSRTDPEDLRVLGNDHFKRGNYLEAVECYTASIESKPSSLAFGNRAMARLKLGEYDLVIEDCTSALELDPHFLKAYQRRAVALEAEGKLQESVSDLEQAVRLEPSSSAVCKAFWEAWGKLVKKEKLVEPKARKVIVEECGVAEENEETCVVLNGSENSFESDNITMEYKDSSDVVGSMRIGEEKGVELCNPIHIQPPSFPENNKDGGVPKTAKLVEKSDKPTPVIVPNLSNGPSNSSSAKSSPLSRTASRSFTCPKTGAEFEIAWKALRKKDLDARVEYLLQINPASLVAMFKTSLTGTLLVGFINTSLLGMEKGNVEHFVALLENMLRVPRFGIVRMCIGKKELGEIKGNWGRAEQVIDQDMRKRFDGVKAGYRL